MNTNKKKKPTRPFSSKDFLEEYVNNYSVVGMEAINYPGVKSNQEIWISEMRKHTDTVWVDKYGNACAVINPKGTFTFGIEAHIDEIGWTITYMDDDGNIYLQRRGGSDAPTFGGCHGFIFTSKGKVPIIALQPPIHKKTNVDTPTEFGLTVNNICVHAGLNKKELEKLGVRVGDVVVQEGHFTELGNYFTARAFDNRIGGFILTEVARRIKELAINLNFRMLFINAGKEEVGLKGAGMVVNNICNELGGTIDLAIPMDVTFAVKGYPHLMDAKRDSDIAMGDGPVVTRGSLPHPLVFNLIDKAAKTANIPIQLDARGNSTGTDADKFHDAGIPVGLLSVALANMHTPIEMIHPNDVVWMVDLYVAIAQLLKNPKNRDFSLLKV